MLSLRELLLYQSYKLCFNKSFRILLPLGPVINAWMCHRRTIIFIPSHHSWLSFQLSPTSSLISSHSRTFKIFFFLLCHVLSCLRCSTFCLFSQHLTSNTSPFLLSTCETTYQSSISPLWSLPWPSKEARGFSSSQDLHQSIC